MTSYLCVPHLHLPSLSLTPPCYSCLPEALTHETVQKHVFFISLPSLVVNYLQFRHVALLFLGSWQRDDDYIHLVWVFVVSKPNYVRSKKVALTAKCDLRARLERLSCSTEARTAAPEVQDFLSSWLTACTHYSSYSSWIVVCWHLVGKMPLCTLHQ